MYKRKDFFYKKAKNEGYRSRASFKLKEIQKKFKIFKNNYNVLDLGCAPGGWLQVASEYCKNGIIVGIDILPTEPIECQNIKIINGNIFDDSVIKQINDIRFNVILSDMAPNTSGIKHSDYYKSYELCLTAFEISGKLLREHGNFIVKIFQGREFEDFYKLLKKYFKIVKIFKPQSSRDTSAETYIVAIGLKASSQ